MKAIEPEEIKLTFVADRPPPPHIAYQEILMDAEASAEQFSRSLLHPGTGGPAVLTA